MIRRIVLTLLGLVFLARGIDGQGPGSLHPAMPDSCRKLTTTNDMNNLSRQMLWAEELGSRLDGFFFQSLMNGAQGHQDAAVQAFAVRALGRLERPELVSTLAQALSSPAAAVRSEAANAIGQAVQGASTADRPRAIGEAVGLLRARLERDTDAAVRGVICETLGRLTYADAASAHATERLLVDATWERTTGREGARRDAPVATELGAVKGLEALLRQQAKLITPAEDTIARLRALALARAGAPVRAGDGNDDVRRVRRLALLALAPHADADEKTLAAALRDGQWEVRRIAVRLSVAGLRAAKEPVKASLVALVRRGLRDADWHVRYEAVSAFARNQDNPDCTAIRQAAGDRNPHVALLAIDQLSRCPAAAAPESSRILLNLVRTLPTSESNTGAKAGSAPPPWHRPAHALVTLARIAPDAARAEVARFHSSPIWEVRMYAARAAAILKDTGSLRKFAGDADDNVRNAAIAGLAEIEQHEADDVYIAQLARSDVQLLITVGRALRGSKDTSAVPELLAALAAQTRLNRDTSRDARLALLDRIGELGDARQANALEPLRGDFDPRVAASAAAILTKWTGSERTVASGTKESPLTLSLEEVQRLDGTTAVVRMKGGGTFTLALLTWEAPATVAGFVRLVECGYYNGLTFHRVEPNFMIQGGSPGANEYAGYKWFMRDEVGLASNLRGAVGLSTRGRNTGDGQWYINLADNARLDHNYTVFAKVVSGMEAVDAILEGDTIADVKIVERRKNP